MRRSRPAAWRRSCRRRSARRSAACRRKNDRRPLVPRLRFPHRPLRRPLPRGRFWPRPHLSRLPPARHPRRRALSWAKAALRRFRQQRSRLRLARRFPVVVARLSRPTPRLGLRRGPSSTPPPPVLLPLWQARLRRPRAPPHRRSRWRPEKRRRRFPRLRVSLHRRCRQPPRPVTTVRRRSRLSGCLRSAMVGQCRRLNPPAELCLPRHRRFPPRRRRLRQHPISQ